LTARVPIQKDGLYHFAANEKGESVRLSEDYFIEARQDDAPTVKITHPGSDAKVSPIEEVTVAVSASDDFALQGVELHYSVNGGAEKVVPIPNSGMCAKPAKDAHRSGRLQTAGGRCGGALRHRQGCAHHFAHRHDVYRDRAVRTQLHAVPANGRRGWGGGGGQEQNEISQRQKEIIAATWNELRGNAKDKAAENARFLADIQNKLKEQAQSLARVRAAASWPAPIRSSRIS